MSRTMPVIGALAMGLVASIAAAKTGKLDPTQMTCEEFVALESGVKPDVIAYLQGYSEGAKGTHPVAVAVPAAAEVTYVENVCAEAPKESLWQRLRAKLPGGERKVADPTKMTCEEYLTLEDAKPEVANWLQGYTEGQKVADRGQPTAGARPTAGAGAAEPAVLDAEEVRLTAVCREAPKKSLWERIKEKL
jgi:hypothetical protein